MKKWWTTGFVSLGIILLSLPELFVEAKHGMENYGYLGGAIIAIYYIHKAYTRHQFRERDKRWEADRRSILLNQRVLMDKAGVGDAWLGPQKISKRGDLLNSRRFFLFSRKALNLAPKLRRRKMGNMNKTILVPVISFILDMLKRYTGFTLPDATADQVAELVLGAGMLIGIFMNAWKHRKGVVEVRVGDTLQMGGVKNGNSQYPVADQPTK